MIDRREFVRWAAGLALGACAGTAAPGAAGQRDARGRDVAWLDDVLQPPVPGTPSPTLAPVLTGEDGRPIGTLAGWRRRRAVLERAWRDTLGSLEVERGDPPALEVIEEDTVGDVLRQRVRYHVEPDVTTEAYVLKPMGQQGRGPGALVLHSTTPESIRQLAGLADVPEKHFGLALARRGFVAFCPRNYLWADTTRMALQEETRRFEQRHPRATGMAKMLFDAQVALDVLAARSDVDRMRLGCIGHSLGAKEVLYLAAFDERIRAGVSSEGGIGTAMSNWDAPWYLGESVRQPGFAREHHELLALAAPRPFLLVGGGAADGAASWPWIEAALPVYRLYGAPARLGLLRHQAGHTVPAGVAARMIEWLETYTGH